MMRESRRTLTLIAASVAALSIAGSLAAADVRVWPAASESSTVANPQAPHEGAMQGGTRGGMQGGAMSQSGDRPTGGMAEMHAAMMKNMKQMGSMPMTGNVDRDFATMMRMHHEGGIAMAEVQLTHGKDPKMREMARKIISDQKKEIEQFDRWLGQSGK